MNARLGLEWPTGRGGGISRRSLGAGASQEGERGGKELAGGAELAQRGGVRPADALAPGHDRAAAGTAVQRDVVHTGPHHGQAAARFGQLGYWYLLWIGLIPQSLRRAAPGEDPRGRGQAGSLVGHLDLAADRAEAGDHRV